MSKTLNRTKRLLFGLILGAFACLTLLSISFANQAYALDEPAYTPGEDYHIDDQDAFLDQDPGYDNAGDAKGSTRYLLTCPFYLKWTSPSMTIYEGDDAYVACEAVGLDDLTYEWYVSKDGGTSFEWAGLVDSEHTVSGLKANAPHNAIYLYRCIITNGDGMSTLTTDVQITVLPNSEVVPGGTLGKTGDNTLPLICLLSAAGLGAAAVALSLRSKLKSSKDDAGLQDYRNPEG